MLCTVFELKANGQRIPPEDVRASGVQGDLRITRQRPSGMPVVEATVLDSQGYALLTMSQPEVRLIDATGILMHGYQPGGSGWELVPQIWWCVPDIQQTQQPGPKAR